MTNELLRLHAVVERCGRRKLFDVTGQIAQLVSFIHVLPIHLCVERCLADKCMGHLCIRMAQFMYVLTYVLLINVCAI